MTQPLVTILTPSFNQAAFLEQSIQSVLSQDYPALEYIIIDGGSTDGSVDIIRKHEQKLAWWVSEKDRGQADAVNKGFAKASGKYCGWLNSDDLYLPGAVSGAVALLEQNPHAGFVYGDVKSIDEAGRVTHIMRYGHWNLDNLMGFDIIGQPGVFFRSDLFRDVGGLDLNYHYLLDHHLWLRFASAAGMQYSAKIWAAARFHSAAKNVANAANFGDEALQLAQWMSTSPLFASRYPQVKQKVWAGAYRIKARYLLDGGKNRESIRAYWQGIKHRPATIFPELHRFLYAILSLMGLSSLKKCYRKLRFHLSRPDRQSE